jgi:hypothetical protein
MKLPWSNLGIFFDYRTQWLGTERVAFLRNLDELPAELREALGTTPKCQLWGPKVTVTLNGKSLDLGDHQAYLDSVRGRVMVPLRATVIALGGQLAVYPLTAEHAVSSAEMNYGLPPFGNEVNYYAEVSLREQALGSLPHPRSRRDHHGPLAATGPGVRLSIILGCFLRAGRTWCREMSFLASPLT